MSVFVIIAAFVIGYVMFVRRFLRDVPGQPTPVSGQQAPVPGQPTPISGEQAPVPATWSATASVIADDPGGAAAEASPECMAWTALDDHQLQRLLDQSP